VFGAFTSRDCSKSLAIAVDVDVELGTEVEGGDVLTAAVRLGDWEVCGLEDTTEGLPVSTGRSRLGASWRGELGGKELPEAGKSCLPLADKCETVVGLAALAGFAQGSKPNKVTSSHKRGWVVFLI
jgi:hypothetical protein